MKKYTPKDLTFEDDFSLWENVKSTVRPLEKRWQHIITPVPSSISFKKKNKVSLSKSSTITASVQIELRHLPMAPSGVYQSKPLDRKIYKKLSAGQLKIEAQLDLHHFKEAEAYKKLFTFIEKNYYLGRRNLLVITGKGLSQGSEALLKRNVPHWLGLSPFKDWVSSFEEAAKHHGGVGALYVRLRFRRLS